ncbi:MAG: HAMP domain-containing sensor histidine kinase [Evtepia sp.]
MIQALKRKFILTAVTSVCIVLFVFVSTINLFNYLQIGKHADEILSLLSENDGHFPKNGKHDPHAQKLSPEDPFSTRFFSVVFQNGTLLNADTGKVAAISTAEAQAYAGKAFRLGKNEGRIENYRYLTTQKSYGTLIVFVDCERELVLFQSFLVNTVLVSLLGMFAVFLLVCIFSKYAIKPIAENYAKQKQFITDASHELKTPLAVISANAEVLDLDFGENEWTKSILRQTARMDGLIAHLVALARLDEERANLSMTDFSISDAIAEAAEPFLFLAQANNNTLSISVEPHLSFFGHEPSIRQLVSILLDNAVKYAKQNTMILLALKQVGKHLSLSVQNQTALPLSFAPDLLFERFYRADSSRNSQTGGHGLGLAIAKAIVLKHKGKINAHCPNESSIIFVVTL